MRQFVVIYLLPFVASIFFTVFIALNPEYSGLFFTDSDIDKEINTDYSFIEHFNHQPNLEDDFLNSNANSENKVLLGVRDLKDGKDIEEEFAEIGIDAKAIKIDVTLNDNREYEARIIGVDPSTDLALLKIDAVNLDYLIFGNSDSLLIGEWVMAVGNPFRLQSTVTAGIVSAKARSINLLENQGIESFIQTDAAVNPGNSGGALINTRGDLIGICTAMQSNSGKFEGFSFAIPSNLAKKVIADLREYGVVQRGWLGIEIENIDNQMASKLALDEVAGVFVASVHKAGGAAAAGTRLRRRGPGAARAARRGRAARSVYTGRPATGRASPPAVARRPPRMKPGPPGVMPGGAFVWFAADL